MYICRESPNIFLTKFFDTVLSVYYFLGILSEKYFLIFHKSGQKERARGLCSHTACECVMSLLFCITVNSLYRFALQQMQRKEQRGVNV